MEDGERIKPTSRIRRATHAVGVEARQIGRELWEGAKIATVDLVGKKVPVDDFNEQTVGARIYHYRGLPQRGGAIEFRPFTKADVLTALGYEPLTWNEDLSIRFAKEYKAISPILYELVRKGILDAKQREQADIHGERLFYTVVDQARLKELQDSLYKPPYRETLP